MPTVVTIPKDTDVLEKLVIHLATLYDRGQFCLDFDGNDVPDPDYDELVSTLRERRPCSIAFQKGKTSPSDYDPAQDPEMEGVKLVKHDPPMTSIAKADGDKRLQRYQDWIKYCCTELGYSYPPPEGGDEPLFVQSFKRDGLAVRIEYKNGKLVKAGLRPRDGINGIDVTKNIVYVKGVPATLPKPFTLFVQGELECTLEDFEKVQAEREEAGEELRANPRNHTYGAINQHKEPKKTKDGRISFTGHRIICFAEAHQYYDTEMEMAIWCNKTLKIPHVRIEPHRFADLEKMEKQAKDLPYEVDGIVLKVNKLEDQEQLGHSGDVATGDPRGALAWKFVEQAEVATVDYIVWNANRTGKITPKAMFVDAVPLAGTMVSKATCSNYGWLRRRNIGKGTKVSVIKAGKIIPKVIAVLSDEVKHIDYPKQCPSCGKPTKVVEGNDGNEELMCLNDDCPAKHSKRYLHYFQVLGAKGLGQSALDKIIGSGRVRGWADFYQLDVHDLMDCEFSERQATLALAAIHMVKPVKDNDKLLVRIEEARNQRKVFHAWLFFAALGVPQSGHTAGKALIDHFGDFASIGDASVDDLLQVSGIGETSANAIHDFFCVYKENIDELLEYVQLELPKVGKLTGKSFVFTGTFPQGKERWQKQVEALGGKCSGSVSKKTDFVVVGPDAGSKAQKAEEYGIKKLDLEGLKKLL